DNAVDLAWAQYMSLKGYFQALSPSGFDGSSMVSYQNGRRAWQIPHVWVYAAIPLQSGIVQWVEMDPTGITDWTNLGGAPGAISTTSSTTNITSYLASTSYPSLADMLAASQGTTAGFSSYGLTSLGPSALDSYSAIPTGSISVVPPCRRLQAD